MDDQAKREEAWAFGDDSPQRIQVLPPRGHGVVLQQSALQPHEILAQRVDTLDARDAVLPTRAHDDDAGYDLYSVGEHTISPGEFVDIPTGVALDLPRWCWAFLTGRSSTLRKHGLMVHPGIIDAGYQGELFAGVFNLSREDVHIRPGDRLAQLIIMENATRLTTVRWMRDDEAFPFHQRGTSGFGSSGR